MKWEQFALELPKGDGLVSSKVAIDFTSNLLMEYGSQGWELVSVDNGIAYFKRPIQVEEQKQTFIQWPPKHTDK